MFVFGCVSIPSTIAVNTVLESSKFKEVLSSGYFGNGDFTGLNLREKDSKFV